MSDEKNEDLEKVSAAARLFDVRRVIGGLFVVYGVIVTLLGIFDSKAEIDKAQGVRINLWDGSGHARPRPADAALAPAEPDQGARSERRGARG